MTPIASFIALITLRKHLLHKSFYRKLCWRSAPKVFWLEHRNEPGRYSSHSIRYLSRRKKCPYSKLFRSVFSLHFPTFGLNTLSVSVQMRENADQNNSEYRHFLCSVSLSETGLSICNAIIVLTYEKSNENKFSKLLFSLKAVS